MPNSWIRWYQHSTTQAKQLSVDSIFWDNTGIFNTSHKIILETTWKHWCWKKKRISNIWEITEVDVYFQVMMKKPKPLHFLTVWTSTWPGLDVNCNWLWHRGSSQPENVESWYYFCIFDWYFVRSGSTFFCFPFLYHSFTDKETYQSIID